MRPCGQWAPRETLSPRRTVGIPPARQGRVLAGLFTAAILLDLAAGTGLSYVAGFSKVLAVLISFRPNWLLTMLGALLVSYGGYLVAYRGVFRAEGGPSLPRRQLLAVVTAGFGGFVGFGGGSMEHHALRSAGADRRQASARAAAFIVGFGTGMVVTRRTGPLAGAGILALALPLAIWYSGAPLAIAVVGLFAYRAVTLWLPMPVTFAALPALRSLGGRPDNEPGTAARQMPATAVRQAAQRRRSAAR